MLKKLLLFGLLWGIFILVVSAIPGSSLPKSPSIPYFDKLVHAALYFVFTLFLIPLFDFSKHRYTRLFTPFIMIVITLIYGGFIEIAQEHWFINRSGDVLDLLSDISGCFLAVVIYYLLLKRYVQRMLKNQTK